MDSVSTFIIFAVFMWGLQIVFGWIQINAFNRVFMEMSTRGRVIVGRNSGRFNPKSVIILALDNQKNVLDGFYMKGVSIFARPKTINGIVGLNIEQIQPEKIFPNDQKSQQALKLAISSVE